MSRYCRRGRTAAAPRRRRSSVPAGLFRCHYCRPLNFQTGPWPDPPARKARHCPTPAEKFAESTPTSIFRRFRALTTRSRSETMARACGKRRGFNRKFRKGHRLIHFHLSLGRLVSKRSNKNRNLVPRSAIHSPYCRHVHAPLVGCRSITVHPPHRESRGTSAKSGAARFRAFPGFGEC